MYDFYFGSKEDIIKNPKKFLLTIKRMLPRWCNSIPDSEYLAIYDAIEKIELPDNPIFVETGSGSSTIILCYLALKNNGELYTWDINGSKLFYLRSVINDTLMRHFTKNNLNNHWKYISYNSNSNFVGIPILKELNKKVSACFLDSEHTLKVLKQEIENLCKVFNNEAIITIDDGNYSYLFQNTAYINMIRTKHNLAPIENPPNNLSKCFWEEIDDLLRSKFINVEHLNDSYKETYKSDIFWAYYNSDRETMSNLSMEKTENLEHRFDAWKISQ